MPQAVAETPDARVRRLMGALAADQVKRTANRTMNRNCERDGVRYARVPTGAETCGFCIMLASRGFVYASARSAGELDHYHRSCDCKVVPGFPGVTEVEGYDPDALLDLYSEARSRLGGSPSTSRISREIEKVRSERDGGDSIWRDRGESGISRKKNASIDADVDFGIIASSDYTRSFQGVTGKADVDGAIAKYAQAALFHRSGTSGEDLFLVSMVDGKLVAQQTSSATPLSVDRSDKIDEAVADASRGSLFAIHNHPSNVPPTGSDLVASGARGYGGAVVVLHDGSVYYYSHGDKPFTSYAFDMAVDKNLRKGEAVREAYENALMEFEERFGITWRRIR